MVIIYSDDPNFKPVEIDTYWFHETYIHINDKRLKSFIFWHVTNNKIRKPEIEDIISIYPECAYLYAYNIVRYTSDRYRWADIGKPEVEDIIGRDPKWAFYYAKDILHCRWADIGKPEVEDIIGKDPMWAYHYVKYVLRKRWADIGKPEVDDIIYKDETYGGSYYLSDLLFKYHGLLLSKFKSG